MIGVFSGDDERTIGTIADAAFGPAGLLLVLDGRFSEVKTFDHDGRPAGSFGGVGQGPGEFFAAYSLAVSDVGDVLVTDEARKVQRFSRSAGGEWRFHSARAMHGVVSEICVSDDGEYVVAHSDDVAGSVYSLPPDGREQPTLVADLYRSSNPAIRHLLGEAKLACDRRSGTLFVLSKRLGELYAFRDGKLTWAAHFSDFRAPTVREMPAGPVQSGLDHPNDTMHVGEAVTVFDSSRVIVQFAVYERGHGASAPLAYDTYVLDAISGEGEYIGAVDVVVFDVRGRQVLVGQEDPYPRIWPVDVARVPEEGR
jgi:hypothetical protein